MEFFFQKYKFVLVPAVVAFVLFGGLWGYRYFNRPKRVPVVARPEINITIIPGWNLRQIASDWQAKGLIKSEDELYNLVGRPAYNYKAHGQVGPLLDFTADADFNYFFADKSKYLSYEGYFLPDTYRVYADASTTEVVEKIFNHLDQKITPEMRAEIARQHKSFEEVLTMASIVEKEAPSVESMAVVADILWRRYKQNWALQVDSSVHYAVDRSGDVFTTAKERQLDSLWNTYKYPGLPIGPISNPSLDAIKAAIYPTKNNYWYFLSDSNRVMYYGKTLDEHNQNKYKYLR